MPAESGKGGMSVLDALKGVLKLALIHDGLARGLRESAKALDRREAHACILNESYVLLHHRRDGNMIC